MRWTPKTKCIALNGDRSVQFNLQHNGCISHWEVLVNSKMFTGLNLLWICDIWLNVYIVFENIVANGNLKKY